MSKYPVVSVEGQKKKYNVWLTKTESSRPELLIEVDPTSFFRRRKGSFTLAEISASINPVKKGDLTLSRDAALTRFYISVKSVKGEDLRFALANDYFSAAMGVKEF